MGVHGHEVQAAQQRLGRPRCGQRMAGAQQHTVVVAQQIHPLRGVHTGQKADGEIDLARVQRAGNLVLRIAPAVHLRQRCLLAQGQHQRGQKARLADVAEVQAQAQRRGRRVEAIALVQRRLQQRDGGLHRLGQPLCTWRGPHAAGCAQEQLVSQQQTQPRQALAGGWLRQIQCLGRAAHTAQPVHRVKQAQQVQVDVVDMHGVHVA